MRLSVTISILILCSAQISCAGTKHNTQTFGSLRITLTLPVASESVNHALSVFNQVQKPARSKMYYPGTPVNSICIDNYWDNLDVDLIDKLKKYCNDIPDKVDVVYEP